MMDIMKNSKHALIVAFVVFVSACVQQSGGTQGYAEQPQVNWRDVSLKDVVSGETFKINDFKGKIVVMESMAVWCPLCAEQQKEIQQAEQSLISADVISVSIDIDPNEDEAKLLSYVQRSGFTWHFAVAPREFSQSLSKQYSALVLNPPSTPVIIIDRDGEPHLLRYGIKSADELVSEINKYL